MFSKELEDLIKASMQDGVLSEQEKRTIQNRAKAEGVNVDELEIYIQSLLNQQGKVQELINRIAVASAKMYCDNGEILFHSETKEVTEEQYNLLVANGKINEYNQVDKLTEVDWKNQREIETGNYELTKNFEYYFSAINELESLYGDLPQVRSFINGEEKKRSELKINEMHRVSNEVLKSINNYSYESAQNAFNEFVSFFGSMPEAQALIQKYQEMLKKKQEMQNPLLYYVKKICKMIFK